MSMNALSESECQEILCEFQSRLPHLPGELLTELAFNYLLEAPVELDPQDVIFMLSAPTAPRIFGAEIEDDKPLDVGFAQFMAGLGGQARSFPSCSGCLLILKTNMLDLPAYGRVLNILRQHLPPQASWGHACYRHEDAHAKTRWQLILTEGGALNAASAAQHAQAETCLSMELPAFLLRGSAS